MVLPFLCRFGFIAARKIFEKKAQKAELELERLIEEKLKDSAIIEEDVENDIFVEDDVDVIE